MQCFGLVTPTTTVRCARGTNVRDLCGLLFVAGRGGGILARSFGVLDSGKWATKFNPVYMLECQHVARFCPDLQYSREWEEYTVQRHRSYE